MIIIIKKKRFLIQIMGRLNLIFIGIGKNESVALKKIFNSLVSKTLPADIPLEIRKKKAGIIYPQKQD